MVLYSVPGDFNATPQGMHDSSTILPQLRDTVSKFASIPTTHHGGHRTFVPSDLQSSKYVFIRRDGHCTPLQRPYEGPFHVLERNPKFFIIDFGGKPDTVSADRLKPEHLDISHPVQVAGSRGAHQLSKPYQTMMVLEGVLWQHAPPS